MANWQSLALMLTLRGPNINIIYMVYILYLNIHFDMYQMHKALHLSASHAQNYCFSCQQNAETFTTYKSIPT